MQILFKKNKIMKKIERILITMLLALLNIMGIIACILFAFITLITIEDYNTKEDENKYEIKQLGISDDYIDFIDIHNDTLKPQKKDSILLK